MRYLIVSLCLIFLISVTSLVVATSAGHYAPVTPIVRLHPDKMPQGERLSYLWDTRTGILLPEHEPIFAQVLNASVPRNERHVIENRTQTELLISLDEFGSSQSTFLYRMNREQENFLSYFWALEYERIWLVFSTDEGETILRGFNPNTGELMQEYRYALRFKWFDTNPDNSWIAFGKLLMPYGDEQQFFDITLVHLQTGETQSLGRTRNIEWSPTGDWLYFNDVIYTDNEPQFTMNWLHPESGLRHTDTLNAHNIIGEWSNDGQYFVREALIPISYNPDTNLLEAYERRWIVNAIDDNQETIATVSVIQETQAELPSATQWAKNTPSLLLCADNNCQLVHAETGMITTLPHLSIQRHYQLSDDGDYVIVHDDDYVQILDNTGANIIQQRMPFVVFNIEFERTPTQ